MPFNFIDVGPDGVAGTADDKTLTLLDRPATAPIESRVHQSGRLPPDFHTVEVALNRRFAGKWMLLTSFGYTWLNQIHATTSSTSATGVAGNLRSNNSVNYRPSQLMFGDNGYETRRTGTTRSSAAT